MNENRKRKSKQFTQLAHCCAVGALGMLLGACASQVHGDATRMRAHALAYYSDQIMDNLIRGKNGLMFVHTDIITQQAQVNTTISGNAAGGETHTNTDTRATTLAGVTNTIVRAVTRPLTWSLTPTLADNLQTQTKPIVNDPEVYKPYLQFLSLQHPGQRLQDGDFDPKLNEVHSIQIRGNEKLEDGVDYVHGTLRKWNGTEYYVPFGYRQAYFDLCMALVGRIKGATSTTSTVKALQAPAANEKRRSGASELPPKPYSLPLQMDEILDQIRARNQ